MTATRRRRRTRSRDFDRDLDNMVNFDWLHLQELANAVALATNTALQFGRTIGLDINPMVAGANWAEDVNWNIAAGVATHTPGAADDLTQVGILAAGKDCRTVVVVTNRTAGSITIKYGTAAGATHSTNDTFTETVTANGADLVVEASNGFDGDVNFTEIQQTDIAASSAFPGPELLVDGDMEAATTAAWTLGRGGDLTKETTSPFAGIRVLRLLINGFNFPYAFQSVTDIGKRYRARGRFRGDGTAAPGLNDIDAGGTNIWAGTNSTEGQSPDFEYVSAGTFLGMRNRSNTSVGGFVEGDEMFLTEANPMNLTNTGMAIGQPGAGNVPYIFLGDGATTGLEYDTIAEWNSKFNKDKLTMAVVVRVDDWSAGTDVIWRLAVDANTEIVLERRASELAWRYNVEGNFDEVTFDTATLPGGSPSELFTMVMTVNTDGGGEIIGYMKGVARGTSTITGSWIGNFDPAECGVFAADAIQTNSLDGGGAHVGLGYRVLSPVEVAQFDAGSGL